MPLPPILEKTKKVHGEISTVIAEAGMTVDNADTTQLIRAIRKTDAGTVRVAEMPTAEELRKYPNGTRLLVGTGPIEGGGNSTVDENNLVHKSGDEVIGGNKTFNDSIILSNADTTNNLYVKDLRAELGVTTDIMPRCIIYSLDKDNKPMGHLTHYFGNTGASAMGIYASNVKPDGSIVEATINVAVDKNGKGYADAPTPDPDSNSTNIATTEWCNNRFAHEGDLTIYVRKTGNDSNDGLSETTAKLTINAAVKTARAYNIHSGTTKINIGEGIWNESIVIRGFNARSVSAQALTFIGAGIDKTIISANSTHTVLCTRLSSLSMQDLTLENTSTDKIVVQCTTTAEVILLRCRLRGNYTIALADANACIQFNACKLNSINNTSSSISSARNSVIYVNNETEINGSFSSATMTAYLGGLISIDPSANITGNCIGTRYKVYKNGVIDSFGRGAEAIPGTIAGTVSTGGQYY